MAGRDGDAGEVGHFVRLDLQLLAAVRARARLEHEMKHILGIDGQAAQLRRVQLRRLGDRACLASISIEREAAKFGGSNVDGIPF